MCIIILPRQKYSVTYPLLTTSRKVSWMVLSQGRYKLGQSCPGTFEPELIVTWRFAQMNNGSQASIYGEDLSVRSAFDHHFSEHIHDILRDLDLQRCITILLTISSRQLFWVKGKYWHIKLMIDDKLIAKYSKLHNTWPALKVNPRRTSSMQVISGVIQP